MNEIKDNQLQICVFSIYSYSILGKVIQQADVEQPLDNKLIKQMMFFSNLK